MVCIHMNLPVFICSFVCDFFFLYFFTCVRYVCFFSGDSFFAFLLLWDVKSWGSVSRGIWYIQPWFKMADVEELGSESSIYCLEQSCRTKKTTVTQGVHLMHPVLLSVSLPRQSVTHARHAYRLCLIRPDRLCQNINCWRRDLVMQQNRPLPGKVVFMLLSMGFIDGGLATPKTYEKVVQFSQVNQREYCFDQRCDSTVFAASWLAEELPNFSNLSEGKKEGYFVSPIPISLDHSLQNDDK